MMCIYIWSTVILAFGFKGAKNEYKYTKEITYVIFNWKTVTALKRQACCLGISLTILATFTRKKKSILNDLLLHNAMSMLYLLDMIIVGFFEELH